MTTEEVAKAMEAWAAAVVPELNTYEHAPREIRKALPLVLAEVQRKRKRKLGTDEANFQQYQFQQTSVNVWTVDLLIMVDPVDSWTASQVLYDMTDRLGDALGKDPTLDQRVSFASEDYEVSFDPPEFEYADGTIARVATFTATVGHQKEA